jgi:transmembrane sensor
MTAEPQTAHDAALDWIIRQREAAFDDWEGFAAWLEAAPGNAELYHAMADADRDVPAMLPPAPRPVAAPMIRRPVARRAWLGGALAAALVAVTTYGVLETRPAPYEIASAAGQPRLLTLADGTRIQMNGGTTLRLDRRDARAVELIGGEAVFTVVHDDAAPFALKVGPATLVDVGTVFNVARRRGTTDVEVAEGEVVFNPRTENVRLKGGRWLRSVDKDTRLVIGEIEPGVVGAWRTGRLVYKDAALLLVAEDLSRNLGLQVEATPAVAQRKFRGVISFGRDREAVMARLGPLLGVQVRRDGTRWLLTDQAG